MVVKISRKGNLWFVVSTIILIAILIIGSFLLFTPAQPLQTKSVIKIGAVLELTGPISPYGTSSKKGMDLALDEINAAGGIDGSQFSVLYEDSKSDPKEGLSACRKLIDVDNVQIITGLIGSSIVLSCAPLANEQKVVLFSAGATSPLISNAGKYVLRNRMSGERETEALAKLAYDKLHITQLAILHVQTDYGTGNKAAFEKWFKGNITFVQSYAQGTADFKTELAKLKEDPSEAVYIIGHASELPNIFKQFSQLGLNKTILVSGMTESSDFLNAAGTAAEGIVYALQKFDGQTSSKATAFTQAYVAKYNETPDLFSALGYDAIYIIAQSLQQSNQQNRPLVDILHQLKFKGVVGEISFNEQGDIQGGVVALKTIKNGKYTELPK